MAEPSLSLSARPLRKAGGVRQPAMVFSDDQGWRRSRQDICALLAHPLRRVQVSREPLPSPRHVCCEQMARIGRDGLPLETQL